MTKMIFTHLKNFFQLIRWFHELLAILPFLSLYLIIDHYVRQSGLPCQLSSFHFFLLCTCVLLLIASGCILNDIMDRDIDKINKPHTHTIGRTVSLKTAIILFASITGLIIALSVYISLYVFKEWAMISAAVYLVSVLYDVYLKRSPLLGNIAIACLASFIPLVIFLFAGECIAALHNERLAVLIYLYALFPFLIIVARELSLDISDMEGDKALGCRTLPIVIGVKRSRVVVLLFLFLVVLLSFFVMCRYAYLSAAFCVVDVLLAVYVYAFQKTHTRIEYIRIGRFLWFIMILGLVGFALSTLYL